MKRKTIICLSVIAGTWNKDVGNYFVTKNVMVIP